MQIKVTFDDIRRGLRNRSAYCMVARAVKREFPEAHVWVGNNWLHVDRREFRLPAYVSRKICGFDTWRWVLPFSFDLPIEASGPVVQVNKPAIARVALEPVLA